MPQLVVGVDAGGTHTIAAVADTARIHRRVCGAAGNPNVAGLERAAEEIADCIERALDGAVACAIVAGVAGVGELEVRDALERELASRFPRVPLLVVPDALVALRAVIAEGDGIVLIAGTGSIAYAQCGGRTLRAGGYGYLRGDPGSGYAIGAATLPNATELSVRGVAERAPAVLRAAAAGDERAAAIVEEAANGLHQMLCTVVEECRTPGLPLVLAGGLLREPNALTVALERRIAASRMPVRVLAERRAPYVGALLLARQMVTRA